MALAHLPFELESLEANTHESTSPTLVVHVKLSNDDFGTPDDRDALFALLDEIVRVVEIEHAGEVIDDVWGHGFCSFYLTGDNPARLASLMRELLTFAPLPAGYVLEVLGGTNDAHTRGAAELALPRSCADPHVLV